MCVLGMTCGFTSCEEELDPWEIVSLEASCSQEELLPYNGGTFTVSVDANTDWTVTVPEWMTVDKASGTGPSTVSVTVDENSDYEARRGMVQITAGTTEPTGNVAGVETRTFAISQQPRQGAINFNVIEAKVERIQDDRYVITSDYSKYYWHRYKATITYEVSSDLTDAEIAEIAGEPLLNVELNERYYYDGMTWHEYMGAYDIPITRGRHTVTCEQPEEDEGWGYYVESVTITPYWTLPTGERFKGDDFNFEVNDSRD